MRVSARDAFVLFRMVVGIKKKKGILFGEKQTRLLIDEASKKMKVLMFLLFFQLPSKRCQQYRSPTGWHSLVYYCVFILLT